MAADHLPAVEVFFDFVSPYSYLAWCQLPAVAAAHGRRVLARPALLGAVLKTLGTRGPAEVPARRAYIVKDLIRRAHAVGVPFSLPPSHPFNPLLALRVAAQPMEDAARARVVTVLFDAVWRTGAGVENEEQIAAALARVPGVDAAKLVARASEPAAKQALRENTDALLAAGGFGVPTMFVDGEMFFGADSLPQLDAFLRGADPARSDAAAAVLARWRDLPASAQRPGA
jgi:2-hydroxychromene-2-carboxylate isomerase